MRSRRGAAAPAPTAVVAATVRRAGGEWSTPRDIAGGGAFFADVAISDRALAVVVWEQQWADGRASAIEAATRRADGSWTEPVELDGFGSRIDVAMTDKGNAVAVWTAWNVLRSATMTPGATWSRPDDIATAPSDMTLEEAEVAINDKLRAVAVWRRWTPDPFAPPGSVIQAAAND